MAFTNVLPGSSRYPDLRLRWAPSTQPTDAAQVFVDITDRWRGWDWGYGRNDELAMFEAGTGSVLLDNRDRAFDPSFGAAVALTVSGNEVTDAVRAADVGGDGLSGDSSFGVWEATTNLCTNGGFETNTTGWTQDTFFGGAVTIARDTTIAKFGTASGKLTPTAVHWLMLSPGPTASAGTVYTASAWIYADATSVGKTLRLECLETGTASTSVDRVLTLGWQRLVAPPLTAASSVQTICVRLNDTLSAMGTGVFVWVDGAQVEAKPIATPYVHTDGGTAARAAGRVQAPASVLDETQGWAAFRVRMNWPSTGAPHANTTLLAFGDSGSNVLTFFFRDGNWRVTRISSGAGSELVVADTFLSGDFVTLICAWTSTQIKISVDGAPFTALANTNIPVLAATTFDLGDGSNIWSVLNPLDSDVHWFACGTGTLTDADAATLHNQGNTDPTTNLLPTAAAATFVWAANDSNASTGSPYAGNIKPRKVFELVAKWATVEYPVFVAYARGFPQTYPALGYDSVVKVDLVDAFAILQSTDLVIGFTRPAELTGARIAAICDAIGVPAALRDIDPGTTTVAALDVTGAGTSGLAHAKAVAIDSEMGQLFVAKDGKLTFHDYDRRLNGTSAHTFTDTAGATLAYTGIEPAYDETYLWNYIRVTGFEGDEIVAVVEDTASQDDYFTITKSISTQLEYEFDVLSVAQRYALRYAQPEERLPSLPMQGAGNAAARWPVILDLEVSDRITVTRFAGETDPKVLTQNVEGIRHSCVPGGPWVTSVPTSPADTHTYFELESVTLGQLDEADNPIS